MYSVWPVLSRSAVVAVACAAVLAVAGCSGGAGGAAGTGTASGTPPVTTAASHALSLAASQARRVTSFTAAMDISASGTIRSHLTGTLAEQTRPAPLVHQVFQVTSNGSVIPGGMETLLTGNAIYLKVRSLAKLLGKPWVKLPFASLKSGKGVSLAPLIHQLQGTNPLAVAQMFPSARNIRRAGSQVINGVPASEYTGTLPVGAALRRLAPAARKLIGPAMSATGVTTARFQVWVDGQHQIRKLVEHQSGRRYHSDVTMVVTSVNQPLRIRAPEKSQVATMPGL